MTGPEWERCRYLSGAASGNMIITDSQTNKVENTANRMQSRCGSVRMRHLTQPQSPR